MKVFLVFLFIMSFSFKVFAETKARRILNHDGSVYQTKEESAANIRASQAADNPKANINEATTDPVASALNESRPQGGTSTRVAASCKKYKMNGSDFKVCRMAPGVAGGNTKIYFMDGKEYNGRVRENSDGTYTLTSNEQLEKDLSPENYKGPRLPEQFNCKNNGEELQCLVCSCFFESRGQSFPERVRVQRSKFSRVMNHRFPGNVCDVTHQKGWSKSANKWIGQYEWTVGGRYYTQAGKSIDAKDIILGVGSTDYRKGGDKKAFNGCVQSASEAMKYRNNYFASYYWTKGIEGTQRWMKTCDKNTASIPGNIIKGIVDEEGNYLDFAHNFRKICEHDEKYLLDTAPRRSLRPVTPTRSSQAID